MRIILGLAAIVFAVSCARATAPPAAEADTPPSAEADTPPPSFVRDTPYYRDDGDEVGLVAPFQTAWISEDNRQSFPHLFELRAEPDESAGVVSPISPGETVNVARIVEIKGPRRGIVREASAGLAVDDVVYWRAEHQYAQPIPLWRRGQTVLLDAANQETIRWDDWFWPDETWALIEREDGSRGWLRGARSAFCLMDEACASHM